MQFSQYSNNSQQQKQSTPAKNVGQPNMNSQLLREFEQELERLREENNQIRFAKDLRERDFENVLFENA